MPSAGRSSRDGRAAARPHAARTSSGRPPENAAAAGTFLHARKSADCASRARIFLSLPGCSRRDYSSDNVPRAMRMGSGVFGGKGLFLPPELPPPKTPDPFFLPTALSSAPKLEIAPLHFGNAGSAGGRELVAMS